MQEKITAAAIMVGRVIYTLPIPARHHDVMLEVWEQRRELTRIGPNMQGFVTNTGRFVRRQEAAEIAIRAGQIVKCKFQDNYLFSEDLW